ncbi:protein Flattop homolog isoform X1 [Hydra vulgaris]|uniref:protein Flattop homolog isoform X1 n=1 Tax=Hydra vulgaris TaxID=6087 RepID=UPI001F5ED818|nr:protein Flattop homolog isoform X1 [Hydra vulgaris]
MILTSQFLLKPMLLIKLLLTKYENSFTAKRLQNYEIPRNHKKHPDARQGSTKFISDENGHLLPGVKRSKDFPWGNFKGTWDSSMDCRKTNHSKNLIKAKIPSVLKTKERTEKSDSIRDDRETCTS